MIWWVEMIKLGGLVALYVAAVPRLMAVCEARSEVARLNAEQLGDAEGPLDNGPPGAA